jgi:hypothetical protein
MISHLNKFENENVYHSFINTNGSIPQPSVSLLEDTNEIIYDAIVPQMTAVYDLYEGGELALNTVKGVKKLFIDDNEVAFEKEETKFVTIRNSEISQLTKIDNSSYSCTYPDSYRFNMMISSLKLRPVDPTYTINSNTRYAKFENNFSSGEKQINLYTDEYFLEDFIIKGNTFVATCDTISAHNDWLDIDSSIGYTLIELNENTENGFNIIETEVIYTPMKPFYFPKNYAGIGVLRIEFNHESTVAPYMFKDTSITSFEMNNGIRVIGNSAFENCELLNVTPYITIPNSVVTIHWAAFANCTNLISIKLSNKLKYLGVNAFKDCSSLTGITIPDTITDLGGFQFSGCTALKNVVIGTGITNSNNIKHAFYKCNNIENISVSSNNPNIDSRNNCNAVIDTATNTLIFGCKNTTIPNSVLAIGKSAFEYCPTLTSITIPNSVITIGESAFHDCKGLTGVTIPDSVTTIDRAAFMSCTGITSVTLGKNLTTIGETVFMGCTSLNTIKCYATTAPSVQSRTFHLVKNNGKLYYPSGSATSYKNTWLNSGTYYLGYYGWTGQAL